MGPLRRRWWRRRHGVVRQHPVPPEHLRRRLRLLRPPLPPREAPPRPLPPPGSLRPPLQAPLRLARHPPPDLPPLRRRGRHFLLLEGGSSALLLPVSALSLLVALPINLSFSTSAASADQFSRTTINNIPKASPLLWVHFVLMVLVVVIAHLGISFIEDRLRITRLRDDSSVAVFTIAVHGVPRTLAADKAPSRSTSTVGTPVRSTALSSRSISAPSTTSPFSSPRSATRSPGSRPHGRGGDVGFDGPPVRWTRLKAPFRWLSAQLGFTDEERLRSLKISKMRLESELLSFKEGRASGAGIAFVVFKDVHTTNNAVRDFRTDRRSKRPIGQFFSVMELKLGRSRWRVERAPPAADIYWTHLGLGKLSLSLRRVAVNTCLLLMLLFCSSPLSIIGAIKSAGRIISAEAMDHAELWWASLVEGSSWAKTILFQFLPNVLIFVSMYIIIPSALSYLSKFERHLTMSGEQRAALLKMVCFFLVNLILLRAIVESSLESVLLRMGRCYLDGEDCKRIEQYMSASFLTRSCLSSLAFLITSTFLGISFDLLAPIPLIKRTIKKFRKNDMLELVPEQDEDYPLESHGEEVDSTLRRPLITDMDVNGNDVAHDFDGRDLSIYPINRSFHVPKQTFDFAQYYAFNLTIFALTMIYSLFAPLVVPVGVFYFGYRYVVDKYNFLFVYRASGFPAGNDGRLMDRVLCIMHFCVVLFLLSMLLFFSVQGDSTKLQAIFTLGILLIYKLTPPKNDGYQPPLLEGMQTVDSIIDDMTDYEVFSQPNFNWDAFLT
ncbi:hypothetical protein QJS10_CPB15g00373 [Acorus calamus]|uniref:CSC1/OSCA1-like 7TM region domain-containing protein n=1 Tax=Acorus calamus TaxID=4465 RepID=A0AAV9D8D4_ACOCL|nr:hypothetical protein QJS10_CPB15g00373 [Acorus calamus]